jgi:hypothetical protein
MKYFTPDLLSRFRSGEIESAEWEQASESYENRFESIKAKIPEEILRPLDSICFHDAKVLTITADESQHLSIFLKLSDFHYLSEKYVELQYRLVSGIKGDLKLLRHPSLVGDGKPFGWWLYDEIDVVNQGQHLAFKHSVLFTGGCELEVVFASVAISNLSFWLPNENESEDQFEALEELLAV